MVTDWPGCAGQRNTSRFPLKKVLPEAFWRSAPCWPAERADGTPARFALGALQLRKGGRGNNFGSCAINVDLDSLRKFSVLLPEESRPIPGGLRKELVDGSSSAWLWFSGYRDCVSKHTPPPAFAVLPTRLFSPLQPSLQIKGCITCQQTWYGPLKN